MYWFKKSLYRELMLRMSVFLIIPFFIMASVFCLKLFQDGEESYQNTLSLVMDQAQGHRTECITRMLKAADRICSNNLLKGFLLTNYSHHSWRYYSEEVSRMVSGGLSYESQIVPKLYSQNESLPRGYGIFYHLSDIEKIPAVVEFMESDLVEQWVTPDMAGKYSSEASYTPFMNHYTYMVKLYSDHQVLYLLTLSMAESDMDAFLYVPQEGSQSGTQDGAFGEPQIMELPGQMLVNYSGKTLSAEDIPAETQNISFERLRFPQTLSYVWPESALRQYFFYGLIIVLTFAVIFPLINIRFVRQIFSRIVECIDRFSAQVKSGCYQPMPVDGENEVAQITSAFNALIKKIQNLMDLTAKQTALAKESQLKALRQQINPHFMYNTLEVFAYRMELYGHEEESDAIASFSGLLRYSLAKSGTYVTLREEMEQVRRYIQIQRLRYEDVSFQLQIVPELMDAKLLPFSLQPLVENCFIHGYSGSSLAIRLTCKLSSEGLYVEIWDNGKGMSQSQLENVRESLDRGKDGADSGIGLGNIDQRLKLFYSDKSGIRLDSLEGFWTKVWFQIPI